MGSGFKSFTAGAVLTASDMNNYLMEQSVMYFATTTARDTAITAPEDGMVVYIGSNDANEGLYTYQGAAWRKGPGWNAPWGHVVSLYTGTGGTPTSSELVQSSLASTTFFANRRYRWTASASYVGQVGGDLFQAIMRSNNTAGAAWSQCNFTIHPTSAKGSFSFSVQFQPGAVTMTPVLSIARVSGSGLANLELGISQIIEDIGPAGAPA
jgi:hypothetical protein